MLYVLRGSYQMVAEINKPWLVSVKVWIWNGPSWAHGFVHMVLDWRWSWGFYMLWQMKPSWGKQVREGMSSQLCPTLVPSWRACLHNSVQPWSLHRALSGPMTPPLHLAAITSFCSGAQPPWSEFSGTVSPDKHVVLFVTAEEITNAAQLLSEWTMTLFLLPVAFGSAFPGKLC